MAHDIPTRNVQAAERTPTVEAERPSADPAPLGLAGFALTTFVLSFVNADILKLSEIKVVLGLAVFYGGLAQFAAGMWEFRKGNTFGALAFSSYGAFWGSFAGILFWYGPPATSAAQNAMGVYLLAWGIFTAYLTVASMRVSGAVMAVLAFLTATYVILAIGWFANNSTVIHVGGYVGIVTAVLAWYASFAGVTNATWRRTVLPTWPARQ